VSAAVERELERARVFLGTIAGAADKAASSALNRATAAGREAGIKAIVDRYAVRPSDIREKVTVTTSKPDQLEAAVVARSGSLALGYFPHTPTLAGTGGPGRPALRAEVLRGQERNVRGAFVATINGRTRIMMRTGGTTASGKSAIKSVYTVPMAAMLGADDVRAAVEARAVGVMGEVLDREIDRALGKAA